MSDKYLSFDELSRNETQEWPFSIAVRQARKSFAIVAPHEVEYARVHSSLQRMFLVCKSGALVHRRRAAARTGR
jgi:phage replication-related protein YjqB (UPF0714/DUF867 family)